MCPPISDSTQLSLSLPSTMASQIRAMVETGDFESDEAVVRVALNDWLEREQRLAPLDEAIAHGLSDSMANRVTPLEQVREALRQHLRT
ncbi:MAG: type II toxin-antitoxin system ParD family antitoxin [Magnetococcales bacterium]|nr:type II toxin-antitoxin system ParD family antitoxin [Magnetococcales bacterium]